MPTSKVMSLPEKARNFFSVCGQESSCRRKIAAHQRFKQRKLHRDLAQVLLVFRGRAGGGAHHVAEVVERQAGHHGVEVDDAKAFAGGVVEQHVVELGVVVRDALGQTGLKQNARDGFPRQGKFDLRLSQFGAAFHVSGDGLLQSREALGCVMEIGNGLDEPRRRQTGKLLLEVAESVRCLKRLCRRRLRFRSCARFQ